MSSFVNCLRLHNEDGSLLRVHFNIDSYFNFDKFAIPYGSSVIFVSLICSISNFNNWSKELGSLLNAFPEIVKIFNDFNDPKLYGKV